MDKSALVTIEDGIIISPDTKRSERIPPGQVRTRRWPVLHAGAVPRFNRATWSLRLFGLVEAEWSCTYDEFLALPRVKVKSDFHCVTTWSLLDCVWEGVSVRDVISQVRLKPEAKFVLVHAEQGWTTNMPLADFLELDCLFAWRQNGQDLTPEHGYPLRLVVPRLYAWKSAKWVRAVEFRESDEPGFWESGGYHMRGDPWTEERYSWNGPAE